MFSIPELWTDLIIPLLRLCLFISVGVFVGNFIEAMNWTRFMAMFAAPLVRAGRLKDISGASFSMAFFSGVSANTMLAEAYEQKKLSRKELVLSNLFNSLPTYFLHLPTTFFIIAPLIKAAAIPYLSLTISSAVLRTIVVIIIGRFFLPARKDLCVQCELPPTEKLEWAKVFSKVRSRFGKRFKQVMIFTVPIYSLFYFLQNAGFFALIERFMADHTGILSFLPPQAISIIVLQLGAEFSAGLAAAGSLLDSGALGIKEVVLALIIGNILSSPVRAIRHQLPYYSGIFSPALAVRLIFYNQSLRAGSLMVVGVVYYFLG